MSQTTQPSLVPDHARAQRSHHAPAWLATFPEVEGMTGRFFVDRALVETAPHTTDVDRCERLWNDSARLVGLNT